MPPSRSSSGKRATTRSTPGTTTTKGRKSLLLAAVCASLSSPSPASAFTAAATAATALGSVARSSGRTPRHRGPLLSRSSSSPPSDDAHLCSAPPTPPPPPGDSSNSNNNDNNDNNNNNDDDDDTESIPEAATTAPLEPVAGDSGIVQRAPSGTAPSPKQQLQQQQQQQSRSLLMDVDGNGTGALMNRSRAAGGVDAPLMAAPVTRRPAFPIDSGKEGMQAGDARARIRSPPSDNNNNNNNTGMFATRLVRYNLPSSENMSLKPAQEKTQQKLVLAPAAAASTKTNGASKSKPFAANNNDDDDDDGLPRQQDQQQKQAPGKTKPKPVFYNGSDLQHSTDYDGMEKPALTKQRNRQIDLKRLSLVRYKGESQSEKLSGVNDINGAIDTTGNDGDASDGGVNNNNNTPDSHRRGRKTLTEDPGYANRYTGLTDFTLAKKTGLAVNKPISLWVERDKFL